MDAVGLAIVEGRVVAEHLCGPVGRTGVERGRFPLGDLGHLAEHLRGGRLVEADPVVPPAHDADRLEHAQDPGAAHVGGQLGLAERELDEADGAEVVDLVGLDLFDHGDERGQVGQVAVDELDLGDFVLDHLAFGLAWPRTIPWTW